MIDVESRPDLTKLLIELEQYGYKTGPNDTLYIPIPQFQRKTDPWWGLALVCKPERTDIHSYICYDGPEAGPQCFLGVFNSNKVNLEIIIEESINMAKKCHKCRKYKELDDLFHSGNGHVCSDCFKKIRKQK